MLAVTINFDAIARITDDQFYQLCRANPDVKFERNARGEIIIMSPTGGETGNCNFEISIDDKMQEYRNNGVKLGWLINRKTRRVEIYCQGGETEILESPAEISGEDILPGFALNLLSIWTQL